MYGGLLMKKQTIKDIIAYANGICRDNEFEMHNKSINYAKITRNRKKYTRKIKHKLAYELRGNQD